MSLPSPGAQDPPSSGTVGFARDIRPLFREGDRMAMRGAFDLWSSQDVASHAQAIAGRLSDGTMPCDGAWPAAHVELFLRWLEQGAQP